MAAIFHSGVDHYFGCHLCRLIVILLIVLEFLYVQRTRNTSAVNAVRALCSFVSISKKALLHVRPSLAEIREAIATLQRTNNVYRLSKCHFTSGLQIALDYLKNFKACIT